MTKNMKVLIVDDNRKLAGFIQEALEDAGYDTSVAYDGQSAIGIFREECFDMAILDYKLPDMDGLKLQQHLDELSDAYFILITAHASIESAAIAVQSKKIIGYETKPLDMNRLLNFLEQVSLRRKAESERKRVEEDLAESNQTIQCLLNAIPESIVLLDPKGKVLAVNDELCRRFDKTWEEVIGADIYAVIPPDTVEKRKKNMRESIRTGLPVHLEDKSGERYIHFHITPVKDKTGQVAKLAVLAIDVTERKQAEQALRESEQIFRTIFDNAPVLIDAFDENGRCILWNKECEKVFGWTMEELNTHENPLSLFYPDSKVQKDVLDTVSLKPEKVFREWRPVTKTGKECITLWANFKIPNGMVINIGHDITERKRAEKLLKESEEQYKRLVEGSPDIVYRYTNKQGGNYYSPRVESVLGYTPDYLADHPFLWHDSIHPDDLPKVDQAIVNEEKRSGYQVEYRVKDAKGNWHWFRDRFIGKVIKDDEIIIEGLATDITERKQAEEKLKKSEERFSLAMQGANDGLWDWNMETGNIYFSPRWKSMLGYAEHEVEPTLDAWKRLVHPNDLPPTLERLDEYLKGKTGQYEVEFRMLHKGGHYVDILSRATALRRNSDNKPLRMVGTHLDLAQRKRTEQALKHAKEALEFANEELSKERDLLQHYFDSVSAIIITLDMEGNITMLNRKGAEMLECPAQNMTRKNWFETCLPQPEGMTIVYQKFKDMIEGKLEAMKYFENEIISASGKRRLIAWHNNYFYNKNNCIVGTISVGEDVTEKRRMEEELMQAKKKAETANRVKSEFLANMSHEIRTPMNAILGFAEILEEKIQDEQQNHYLSLIRSNGKALLVLLNDILDLSKVEAGKMEINYKSFSLRYVFQEIENMFLAKIKEKNLDFHQEIDPDLPQFIRLDPIRLRQILLNLVGNAVKFTECGYIKIKVQTIRHHKTAEEVDLIISVEDTGPGIFDDQKDAVFNVFEQQKGHDHARYGGTGLGLAITKRLVEMMKGDISVSGEKGKGSIFTVKLKNVCIEESSDTFDKKHKIQVNPIIFEKSTILVADDILDNRLLLVNYLNDYNFKIIEAKNGQEACDLAQLHLPDLIFMDIKMPVMNGREATMNIKAHTKTKEIPIVVVTASVMGKTKEEILKFYDGYLKKPISKEELIAELSRFLKHSIKKMDYQETEQAQYVETGEFDFNKSDLENLKEPLEMIQVLETDLLPQIKALNEMLIMDEVEECSDALIRIGLEFAFPPLSEIGEKLTGCLQVYNINGVKEQFKKFHQIYEWIKSQKSNG